MADYYHCFVDSNQSDKQLTVCWTSRGLLWYVVNSEQSAGELVAPASAVSTVSDFLTQSAISPESRDSGQLLNNVFYQASSYGDISLQIYAKVYIAPLSSWT